MKSETIEKVLSIAKDAEKILLKYHKQDVSVDYKRDMFDPVTIADKESDACIRSALTREFPEDSILSEENETRPDSYEGRVWMVDPLDGTRDFVAGGDNFGIHIGLLQNKEPVLGVVVLPVLGTVYFAEKGSGAFCLKNGHVEKIHVNNITTISEARLITRKSTNDIRPIETMLDTLPFKTRLHFSCIGMKLGMIAEGNAEAHINTNSRASKWDTLAPQVILEEAGGIITDMDGSPLDYTQNRHEWKRTFVAANNKIIHDSIITHTKHYPDI